MELANVKFSQITILYSTPFKTLALYDIDF